MLGTTTLLRAPSNVNDIVSNSQTVSIICAGQCPLFAHFVQYLRIFIVRVSHCCAYSVQCARFAQREIHALSLFIGIFDCVEAGMVCATLQPAQGAGHQCHSYKPSPCHIGHRTTSSLKSCKLVCFRANWIQKVSSITQKRTVSS